MENEKRVIIGRPINGISINGLEYALDEHGEVKEFVDKKEAEQFLKDNGFPDEDLDFFIYEEIETRKEKPIKTEESLKKPAQKRKQQDRDDDRGR
jgi:hypothetical protein